MTDLYAPSKEQILKLIIAGETSGDITKWAEKELAKHYKTVERQRQWRRNRAHSLLEIYVSQLHVNTDYTAEKAKNTFGCSWQWVNSMLNRAVQSGLMTVRAEIINNKAVKVYRRV